ncbi:hypothetical protein [Oceanobacillus kimchii]|uniref:hypothetical protein n=1 Tax=Oceanobacillus kimchii TaxID=746691 RepID=UPI003C785742
MNLQVLIDATPTLLGVIIGGVITFSTQFFMQSRDEKKKKETDKLKAYNEILKLEETTPSKPPEYPEDRGFDWKIYKESTRKVLLDNLHLFDKLIVEKVFSIEDTVIEAKYIHYDYYHDHYLYDEYNDIIKYIREDYAEIKKKKK